MAAPEWIAANALVGGALALVATTLLIAGRRRSETILLAVYLLLVAVNYGAITLADLTQDARFHQVAYVALALDPFYLLAFVTLYPHRHRPPAARALLAVLGGGALLLLPFIVLAPERVIPEMFLAPRRAPFYVLLVALLAVGYAAAWRHAIDVTLRAPTPLLRQRARWLMLAVGFVVLPRLTRVPSELDVLLPLVSDLWNHGVLGGLLAGFLSEAVWTGTVVLASVAYLRRAANGAVSREDARAMRAVSVFAFVIVLGGWALATGAAYGLPMLRFSSAVPFALRWLPFAGALAYGIFAYETVQFRAEGERVLAWLGGAVAGLAGAIATVGVLGAGGTPVAALAPAALAAAVAVGAVGHAATQRALWRWPSRDAQRDRAHELFLGLLESAYADGAPSAAERRLLDVERARLGLSRDAARALEHVVSRRLLDARAPLRPGDEPLVGVIVEAEIGRGAHSVVHVARSAVTGERVVLKQVPWSGDGAAARRRVVAEAGALQRLSHPNVVRLLDVDVTDGRYLLVMEHVEARPLSRLLREPLPAPRVAALARDVLAGLEAAHAQGIVHRDVKPENILVTPEGRALITDFGIALDERTFEVAPGGTGTLGAFGAGGSALAGTLRYMAPEQARGEATPRSDLYAVGLVALEALTGRPARDLRGLPAVEALSVVALGETDLSDVPDDAWRAWLERALAPRATDRFASAREMLDALPAPTLRGRAPSANA